MNSLQNGCEERFAHDCLRAGESALPPHNWSYVLQKTSEVT